MVNHLITLYNILEKCTPRRNQSRTNRKSLKNSLKSLKRIWSRPWAGKKHRSQSYNICMTNMPSQISCKPRWNKVSWPWSHQRPNNIWSWKTRKPCSREHQFSDLLKQAVKFEKNYNEVPTMTLSISSNTADLQRTITAQNSKINNLKRLHNMAMNSLQK